MTLGINYFGIVDYILLGSTLLVSLLIGLYYGYKGKNTNEELLLGGRNMSVFPVAASVMVTYISAIGLLGFPSEVYAHGSQIYMYQIFGALGILISPFVFVPFFYPMKLISVNEYLERRFHSKWIRWLSTGILILQQVILSGVMLYSPSIPMEAFLGIPMWVSVLGVGLSAIIYTSIGGLKAVVLTDTFQCFMMIGGMAMVVWKGITTVGGFGPAFSLAKERGRLQFFDFTFDPFTRHNFWNFCIGTTFHAMMHTGIHQMKVQRFSGMSDVQKAKRVIWLSVPLKLIMMSLCLITGYAIFAFYANCDPIAKGDIKKIDQILPHFVAQELRDVPGMLGLFTSCIFSAVLSSFSSSLNSLSAVTWEDFLVKIEFFSKMSPKAQTNVSRITGVIYGAICIALAFSVKNLGALYSATIAVLGASGGALDGTFIMAMFLPFVNATGVIVGSLSGFVGMSLISVMAFINKSTSKPSLPLSTAQCPANMTFLGELSTTTPIPSVSALEEWPMRFFSLSYLLYAFVAAFFSIIVGILVSLVVNRCNFSSEKKRPHPSMIHPFVRKIFSGYLDDDDTTDMKMNGLYMNSSPKEKPLFAN